MTARLLFVTDTHGRGKTPRCRKDDFLATLIAKIREVGQLAQAHGVAAVIHGGDFFDAHQPAPSVAAALLQAWREAMGDIPTYVVPGNHDELGQNPELIDRTMLGLGAAVGIFRLLGPEPVVIEQGGTTVQLTGGPYHYEIDRRDPALDYVVTEVGADRAVHVAHGMLVREPIYPGAPYTPLEAIWDRTAADLTLAGHNHLGFPLTERGGRLFYNPGALVRITADSRDMGRTVRAVLIEAGPHGVEVEDLPLQSAQPAEAIRSDDAEATADLEAERKLRAFVEAIREVRKPGESLLTLLDRVAAEAQVDPSTVETARAYLAQALAAAQERGEEAML